MRRGSASTSTTGAISTTCRRTSAGSLRFDPVESVDDGLTQALEPPVARLAAA